MKIKTNVKAGQFELSLKTTTDVTVKSSTELTVKAAD